MEKIMKIGVVGCGEVGSASAYACVLRGIGTELVLVDKNEQLAIAQAEDISHATPFAKSMPITAGNFSELQGARIVMIAAGVGQKPGETRLDLLKRNAEVFEEIIPKIIKVAPDAILLIATNPVDIMTHMAANIATQYRHAAGKVMGSGTILDTARFRTLLAQHLRVSSHSVHAHVLGEHGDSEVLHWSGASVSNISLENFFAQSGPIISEETKNHIDEGVRKAADRIIRAKGATWFGIGAGMARIAQAITEDERSILTCCAPLVSIEGISNVTLSLPHIISAQGVEKLIYPELDEVEKIQLHNSAAIIKAALDSIGY
jgi:L-lactate dehydrogenase